MTALATVIKLVTVSLPLVNETKDGFQNEYYNICYNVK